MSGDHPSWPAELVEKAREAVKTHEWEAEDGTLELCDEIVSVVLSALSGDLVPREEHERLASECARCEKCGHVQAEPNWCHECGHRTTMPEWAKPLVEEAEEAERLECDLYDVALALDLDVIPGDFPAEAAKVLEASRQADALAEALEEAIALAEEGWDYAESYFREKWQADAGLDKARSALASYRSKPAPDREGQ